MGDRGESTALKADKHLCVRGGQRAGQPDTQPSSDKCLPPPPSSANSHKHKLSLPLCYQSVELLILLDGVFSNSVGDTGYFLEAAVVL